MAAVLLAPLMAEAALKNVVSTPDQQKIDKVASLLKVLKRAVDAGMA